MLFNATYDSLDAIPEEHRGEFEQVNGKWQLKMDSIPGIAALCHPALHANEQRAVGQVKARNEKIQELEGQIELLKNQNAATTEPGAVVLSPADAKLWKKYSELGTPADLQKVVERNQELETVAKEVELTGSLSQLETAGLNMEVLTDWAKRTEGVSFFMKEIKGADGKMVNVPHVKVEDTKDGKTTVSDHVLLDYAKEKMPEYMFNSLTAVDKDKKKAPVVQTPKAPEGTRVPNLGGSATTTVKSSDEKKPVESFNEARANTPNPFMPAAAKQ